MRCALLQLVRSAFEDIPRGSDGPRGAPGARPRRMRDTVRLIFAVPERLPKAESLLLKGIVLNRADLADLISMLLASFFFDLSQSVHVLGGAAAS